MEKKLIFLGLIKMRIEKIKTVSLKQRQTFKKLQLGKILKYHETNLMENMRLK